MKTHLLVCLSLGPLLIFGYITAEKQTLDSDVFSTNITNVDNYNNSPAHREYHKYWGEFYILILTRAPRS